MNKTLQHTLITSGLILLTIFVVKRCEGEPKVITKTTTVVKTVTDTIERVVVSKPVVKYVEKIKTVKGKDSIIYRDKPSNTTLEANQYDTQLKTNNATATLKVTTTGELLDVSGTIDHPEKTVTTTITKIKPKSGAFLYAETQLSTSPKRFEVGIDYQLRNKILIGVSADYSNITKTVNANIKLGIKIF
jgi:hypothetical protein